ncbi:colicin immunity domain-containing protein [Metabacillus fastidiosus]|uniref:colicin immunity domain-containing protein n=1 Tax=Metabacillus fastidiosus TaxID=1458 RepID=UPI003D2A5E6F
MKDKVFDKYMKLIESFLKNEINVGEFEKRYLRSFKDETEKLGENLFIILNDLFESVDRYWNECKPGEETDYEISEEQLKVDAEKAFQNLLYLQTL